MAPQMSRCTAALRQNCSLNPVLPFLSRQWLQRTFHGSSVLLRGLGEDKSKEPASKYNEVLDTWRKCTLDSLGSQHDHLQFGR